MKENEKYKDKTPLKRGVHLHDVGAERIHPIWHHKHPNEFELLPSECPSNPTCHRVKQPDQHDEIGSGLPSDQDGQKSQPLSHLSSCRGPIYQKHAKEAAEIKAHDSGPPPLNGPKASLPYQCPNVVLLEAAIELVATVDGVHAQ